MVRCSNHPARATAGTCRSCLQEFCPECLVYAFGEGKPPYCIDCALEHASGAATGQTPTIDLTEGAPDDAPDLLPES